MSKGSHRDQSNPTKHIQSHLFEFFEVLEHLGSGAYGHVWKVKDKQTQQILALKKIFDAFQNQIDSQRTYREITVLHQLHNNATNASHQISKSGVAEGAVKDGKYPHIVELRSVIHSKNHKDLYLVFEYMETDLHTLVGQGILQTPHITYIAYQIFKSLKYLHSVHLIHRDLKPSNILINSECEIKLCDFGLVRSMVTEEEEKLVLTEDVATRWYRSPEMLLGSADYDQKTDVWSVGCILAELLKGEPLLMGESNLEQFRKILQLTGVSETELDIQSVVGSKGSVELVRVMIDEFGNIKQKSFDDYFSEGQKPHKTSEDSAHQNDCGETCSQSKDDELNRLKSLILKSLQFNPQKRISVEEALEDPVFQSIRCREEEITCDRMIIPDIDDNKRFSIGDYHDAIYKDIQRRYPKYNYSFEQQEDGKEQKKVQNDGQSRVILSEVKNQQATDQGSDNTKKSSSRPTRSPFYQNRKTGSGKYHSVIVVNPVKGLQQSTSQGFKNKSCIPSQQYSMHPDFISRKNRGHQSLILNKGSINRMASMPSFCHKKALLQSTNLAKTPSQTQTRSVGRKTLLKTKGPPDTSPIKEKMQKKQLLALIDGDGIGNGYMDIEWQQIKRQKQLNKKVSKNSSLSKLYADYQKRRNLRQNTLQHENYHEQGSQQKGSRQLYKNYRALKQEESNPYGGDLLSPKSKKGSSFFFKRLKTRNSFITAVAGKYSSSHHYYPKVKDENSYPQDNSGLECMNPNIYHGKNKQRSFIVKNPQEESEKENYESVQARESGFNKVSMMKLGCSQSSFNKAKFDHSQDLKANSSTHQPEQKPLRKKKQRMSYKDLCKAVPNKNYLPSSFHMGKS